MSDTEADRFLDSVLQKNAPDAHRLAMRAAFLAGWYRALHDTAMHMADLAEASQEAFTSAAIAAARVRGVG